MYIRANTPTFTEEQLKIAKDRLKRIQTMASPSEIWMGKSLNVLLEDLRASNKKAPIEPIHLSDGILRHLNVTQKNANLGLLRDNGRFDWPIALQDQVPEEKRKEIELKAQNLIYKAANGKIDDAILKDLQKDMERIRETLVKNVNQTPTSQYIDAKRFLNDFEDARSAVAQGDGVKYFEFQKFVANGKTVQDVVNYMVERGLKFAPAVAGDEAAYQAFHSALAAYDIAMSTQVASTSSKE
jgi:hypothetical protein